MPDYSKSKIYKIVCNITGETYYGSTCQSLAKRVGSHRDNFKRWKNGKYTYVKSYDIIERGDYDYSLVEECSCDNKEQLHARERYYIENNECVNKNIPSRTRKEYREQNKEKIKEYYEDNKEHISERKKEWYQANKEKIEGSRKQKIVCECGSEVTKTNLSRHLKSKKHIAWVESHQ